MPRHQDLQFPRFCSENRADGSLPPNWIGKLAARGALIPRDRAINGQIIHGAERTVAGESERSAGAR
jgi:hypothetical protein